MTAELELRKHIRSRFLRSAYTGLIGNMVAAFIWSVGLANPLIAAQRLRWWLALMLIASISMAIAVGVPSISRVATRHGVPYLSIFGLALAGCLWGVAPWLHPDAGADPAFAYGTGAILLGISTASMVASSGSLTTTAPLLIPIFVGLTSAAFTLGLASEGLGLILLALFAGPAHVQSARGIQELVVLRFEGEWAARIDPLSGLLNRRGIDDVVSERGCTDGGWDEVQLIFIDLDNFKAVNDTHGHDAGDQLIAAVAERLRQTCTDAVVGRLGGDEFVVIVAAHQTGGAIREAQAVKDMFSKPFSLNGDAPESIPVTASIGVSAPGRTTDLYQLLDQADRAMFTAKHEGGDLIREVCRSQRTLLDHLRKVAYAPRTSRTPEVIIDLSDVETLSLGSISEQRA